MCIYIGYRKRVIIPLFSVANRKIVSLVWVFWLEETWHNCHLMLLLVGLEREFKFLLY